jgi:hypothetical protein
MGKRGFKSINCISQKRIVGVKEGYPEDQLIYLNNNMSLIRKPDSINSALKDNKFIKMLHLDTFDYMILYKYFVNYLLLNALLVCAHMVQILIVPAIFPIITFLALC